MTCRCCAHWAPTQQQLSVVILVVIIFVFVILVFVIFVFVIPVVAILVVVILVVVSFAVAILAVVILAVVIFAVIRAVIILVAIIFAVVVFLLFISATAILAPVLVCGVVAVVSPFVAAIRHFLLLIIVAVNCLALRVGLLRLPLAINLVLGVIPWRIGAISWKLINKRGYRLFDYYINKTTQKVPMHVKPFSYRSVIP